MNISPVSLGYVSAQWSGQPPCSPGFCCPPDGGCWEPAKSPSDGQWNLHVVGDVFDEEMSSDRLIKRLFFITHAHLLRQPNLMKWLAVRLHSAITSKAWASTFPLPELNYWTTLVRYFMTTDLWSAISRSLKEQKLPEKKTKTSADLNPQSLIWQLYLANIQIIDLIKDCTVNFSPLLCVEPLSQNHEYSLHINSTYQYSKSIL